jgi:hypothetical protein
VLTSVNENTAMSDYYEVELEPLAGAETEVIDLRRVNRLGTMALVGGGAVFLLDRNPYGLFLIGSGVGFYTANKAHQWANSK